MAGPPWYSHGDEVPLGVARMRSGATFRKAYLITEVDPVTKDPIAPRDLTDYDPVNGGDLYFSVSAGIGGTALVVSHNVTIQGAATAGTVLIVVPQADTKLLYDALQGSAGYGSLWGVSAVSVGDPEGTKDNLAAFTVALLPAIEEAALP